MEGQSETTEVSRLGIIHKDGGYELSVPEFEYTPLNLEIEETRFFILHPPIDGLSYAEDHVRCSLLTVPLSEAPPFVAVKNARGYRRLNDFIEVDGKALIVPGALEGFLRHFRKLLDKPTPLWVRHLCLNQPNEEERTKLWTRELSDKMYAKAIEVVDMSEFNATLLEEGSMRKVAYGRHTDPRRKEWIGQVNAVTPTVYPIRLGKQCKNPAVEPPVEDHEYVPLDMVADEIRILVLMPSVDPSAPIVFHSGHCPIRGDATFAALSYRWGTDETTEEINTNGLRLKIRKTLADTIRSFRVETKQQPLWIDAVSINQEDVMERNRQVPRMGEIFDSAGVVICHTGPATDDSHIALELIKELQKPMMRYNEHGEWHFGEESYEKETGWQFGENQIKPDRLARMCAALYKFLTRPYYRRTWMLQEWAWASNPIIFAGSDQVSFEQLDMAAYNFLDMLVSDPSLAGQMSSADSALEVVDVDQLAFPRKLCYFRHLASRGLWRNGLYWNPDQVKETAPGYLEALILARSFECTDPRDKVFALWNLAQDKIGLEYKMDYTKSLRDVYADFAKAWVTQHRKLDILGAVEVTPQSSIDFYSNAPSWSPDWSVPSTASCLVRKERIPISMMFAVQDQDGELYSADGGMNRDSFSFPLFHFEGDTLHCTGVILDQINHIFPDTPEIPLDYRFPRCDPPSYYKFQIWKDEIREYCVSNNITRYEDPIRAAEAMFHGDNPSAWPPREENLENIDDAYPFEKYVCIPAMSRHVLWYGGNYDRPSAWDVVKTVLRGRVPFMSGDGYMGLCPEYIRENEDGGVWHLAIIAGCSVPLILREREDGSYQLCGTAFVQGWMEGEVLGEMMGAESSGEFWEALQGDDMKLRIY